MSQAGPSLIINDEQLLQHISNYPFYDKTEAGYKSIIQKENCWCSVAMWDFEVIVAFVVWTGAIFYSFSEVVNAGKFFQNYKDDYGDFADGWLVNDRKKDVADYEWQSMLVLLHRVYPWLILNAIISEYFRYRNNSKVIPWWQFIIGLSFTYYNVGMSGSIIAILQPILFEMFYKFQSKTLNWICSCMCLGLITYYKSIHSDNGVYALIQFGEQERYFLIMTICWMNMRCLSYYLDIIDNKNMDHSVIQVLAYCFYLPTVFLGPFIPFSSFKRSKKDDFKQTLCQRLKVLFFSILRFGMWFVVTEYFLHYMYVNAISFQPELVRNFNSWTLYGYGYAMGHFFHLKYVVFYGISTCFAKFDHIIAPNTPKCISRINVYSDMWRFFDVGLYKFLLTYIYLPTLLKENVTHKIFASFLSFTFVYIWHGMQTYILVWAALNFFGILLENIFKTVCDLYNLDTWFGFKWKRRLLCIIASPLLAVSALSNFYFFAGMEIGLIFMERLLYGYPLPNVILLILLSCCGYVSHEVKQWESQTTLQLKKHTL